MSVLVLQHLKARVEFIDRILWTKGTDAIKCGGQAKLQTDFLQTSFNNTMLRALQSFLFMAFWILVVDSCTSPCPFQALNVLKMLWDLSSTIPMQWPKGFFQKNQTQWQCIHICSLCQRIYSIVCSPGINGAFSSFISSVGLYKGQQRTFSLLGTEWGPCFAQLGMG